MTPIKTTDVREREDMSEVIDQLFLSDDDMKMLSFVQFLPRISNIFGSTVRAQKHEWKDDEARAESITSGTSGSGADWDDNTDITDLPINSADITKLRVGDVLLLGTGDEVCIVSAIDTAANTIDVYARGHGSSTATAQGTGAFTITIIGNAQIEGSDPMDANAQMPTDKYNYTQIFEDVANESGTVRRSAIHEGNELDYQIVKKVKELLKSLNYAIVEGLRNLDTTNNISTLGGLREWFSTTYNVNGSLTLAKLYSAITAHVDAGLVPHAIHASPTVMAKIEQLFVGNVRHKNSDTVANMSVATISIMGYEVELLVDRHVRTSEFLIVDRQRVAYGPLDGGKYESGEFAVYDLLDKQHGKQHAKQVLGEYTVRVSNGGGTRAYGIT